MPDNAIMCGLPAALSVIVKAPVLVPVAVGAKVTGRVQLAPAATVVPHASASAKSPLVATPEIVSTAVPLLVRVMFCAGLVVITFCPEKVKLADESVTRGAVPVPDNAMLCGLPAALSVIVTAPVLVPVTVGLNVTLMAQLTPAATGLTQLLVWAKSPLATMLEMVNPISPELVTVTVWAALVVPTNCPPNDNVEGRTVGFVPNSPNTPTPLVVPT